MTPMWHRPGRTRREVLLAVAAGLTVVSGVLVGAGSLQQHPAPPQPPSAAGGPRGSGSGSGSADGGEREPSPGHSSPGRADAAKPLPLSRPERIVVPSLGISSTLERLGLDSEQVMETPRAPGRAGWYERGTAPGSKGPAVLAGHVTWNGTPAVFFRLGRLKPGDRIEVVREDGRTAVFTVDRTERFAKKDFPTVEVYRNPGSAALRLITCGGEYSAARSRYSDNVVVFATLTGSRGGG